MTVELPIRAVSESNARDFWAAKARRVKMQRGCVRCFLRPSTLPKLPVAVTLTRIAPRVLDDDNAVRSLKAVRDQIAEQFKVDDRDPRITFAYAQEQRRKTYAVRVDIRPQLGVTP